MTAVAATAVRERQPTLRLFVPSRTVATIAVWSLVVMTVTAPWYIDYSLWIGPGVFLTCFAAAHSLRASRVLPWIPGLAALVACVEWVIAPWAAYAAARNLPVPTMAVDADEYFSFAVPALWALVTGWYLPLRRAGRAPVPLAAFTSAPRSLLLSADLMLVVGLLVRIFIERQAPVGLRFAFLLVGQLAYVGAFTHALARSPGWVARAAAVLAVEAFFNSADAQFLDLALWSMFLGTLIVYRRRVRTGPLVAAATAAVLGIFALNGFKSAFRMTIAREGLDPTERPALAARSFYNLVSQPDQVFSAENVAFNTSRLNQGWTIALVMRWVPQREPYARGETVVTALRSALVPRLLDPNKPLAGGFDNFERFTGRTLVGSTSINLSVAGEMYANFGRSGALLATLGYGLLLGMVFRLFVRWSRQSPYVWAWAPFALISTVSAESGLTEVLNQLSKSLPVMLLVTQLVPAWAALRIRRRRPITSNRGTPAPCAALPES